MIQEAVNTFLDSITSRFFGAIDFVTDPFYWHYLPLGIAAIFVIIAATVASSYFFGDMFKWLRPIGGVLILLITFGLYTYRRGEKDGEARRKPAPKPAPPKQKPWNW